MSFLSNLYTYMYMPTRTDFPESGALFCVAPMRLSAPTFSPPKLYERFVPRPILALVVTEGDLPWLAQRNQLYSEGLERLMSLREEASRPTLPSEGHLGARLAGLRTNKAR